MLAIPPQMAHALEQATGKPVAVAELTTGVIDKLISLYNEMTTVSENPAALGYVLAEHRTQIKNEDTGNAAPPAGTNPYAMVQRLYPAQGGDPTQTVTVIDVSAASGDLDVRLTDTPASANSFGPTFAAYQTFRFAFPDQDYFLLTSVVVRLKRGAVGTAQHFDLVARIRTGDFTVSGTTRDVPDIILTSAAVNTASLSETYSLVTFTFPANTLLNSSQQYALELAPVTAVERRAPVVFWEAYQNRGLALGESSGSLVLNHPAGSTIVDPTPGVELFHRINIAAYSYDGTTPSYRDFTLTMPETPTETGYLDVDYRTPGDSAVRFRLWGSATGSFSGEETDLGSTDSHTIAADGHDGAATHVHDGDAVAPFLHYKLREELLGTSNAGAVTQSHLYTPSVHKRNIVFPRVKHRVASAHVLDALPAIKSIPAMSAKLDLKTYIAQTQTSNLELVDLGRYVSDIGVEEHLKNAIVEQRIGMINGSAPTRWEHLAKHSAGKVLDYGFRRDLLNLKIQDRSLDLSVKIPALRGTGNQRPQAIKFVRAHMVDALIHLLVNEVRTPRRYLDLASFAAVKTALGSRWTTSRTIAEPVEAREVINQLLELIGCFLIVQEDGRYALVRYPRSANAVAAWSREDFLGDPEQVASFETSIVNRCVVWWGYNADGTSVGVGEFAGAVTVNALQSQADFAPGAQAYIASREIKGYWLGRSEDNGQELAEEIARRVVEHAKDGVLQFTVSTSLRWFALQRGDFVTLATDVYLRRYKRGSVKAPEKCMVIGKIVDLERGKIDWTLVEARDLNRPPRPVMSLSTTSGTAPFSVQVNPAGSTDPDGDALVLYEVDADYDGHNFQRDASNTDGNPLTVNYGVGSAGRKLIALRVTDEHELSAITTSEVRAKVIPEAVITVVYQSNPGQPLNILLSGAQSTSRSSQIVRYQWDDDYVSPSFVADAEGVQYVRSMPARTFTIALRVTDADGLSHVTSLTLTGKDLAPPDVQNFLIQQRGDDIILTLAAWTDGDIEGVEIRAKYEPTGSLTATWATADLITPNGTDSLFKTTEIRLSASAPYGTWAFFAKLKDTSGNYSVNAISILATLVKPGTRYPVTTNWSENDNSGDWTDVGKTSQLVYEAATDSWLIGGTGELLGDLATETLGSLASATLGSLGTMYTEGTYTLEEHGFGQDITGSSVFWVADSPISGLRVMITPVVEYLGNPEETDVIVEIRTGTWNGASVDWGPWGPLLNGDITAAAMQARVTLRQYDGSSNVRLKDVIVNVDLPRLTDDHLVDQAVAIGGTSFTFTTPFRVKPSIAYKIQNMGTTPLYVDETAKSGTGVTIRLRASLTGVDTGSGSPATQLVDITATGA